MDTLYTGGPILTMSGPTPEYVEALGVSDGTISFAGALSDAEPLMSAQTQRVDLAGRAMLPGFVDAHGHIVVAAHQIEQAWLRGEMTDEQAVADMAVRFQALVEIWNKARAA